MTVIASFPAYPAQPMRPRATGHPGYSTSLVCIPPSAALARMAARTTLTCWAMPDELIEDAALVASELVTNAVQHANPTLLPGDEPVRCRLEIERPRPDTVRIAVSDPSGRRPVQRTVQEDQETGHGLAVVAVLAADWGVTQRLTGGKTVWALLRVADR
ncbi:ATP-binding protein [Streptomyces sp. WZ-12]|uniref:ATP-binding protein n=1 Tax=Streptomyces sp. WZ-12 TaxID=3030210 RepID=UPI0023817485|nr:ATP-binding protein [Streptomyces sp. WZ-12]